MPWGPGTLSAYRRRWQRSRDPPWTYGMPIELPGRSSGLTVSVSHLSARNKTDMTPRAFTDT